MNELNAVSFFAAANRARERLGSRQMGNELRGRLQPSAQRAFLDQRIESQTLPQGLEIIKLAPKVPAKNKTLFWFFFSMLHELTVPFRRSAGEIRAPYGASEIQYINYFMETGSVCVGRKQNTKYRQISASSSPYQIDSIKSPFSVNSFLPWETTSIIYKIVWPLCFSS